MHLKCPNCKEKSVKVTSFKKHVPYSNTKDRGTLVCEQCGWVDLIQ